MEEGMPFHLPSLVLHFMPVGKKIEFGSLRKKKTDCLRISHALKFDYR